MGEMGAMYDGVEELTICLHQKAANNTGNGKRG